VANFQLDILLVFATGGVLGLMLFSRFLTWLLRRFHTLVIATMCGFLVGSLNVIWPWKLVTESVISQSGKVIVLASENLLPAEFSQAVGQDPLTLLCAAALTVGLVLVLGLEYIGVKYRE
jgi:putative membrane protein